MAEKVRIFSNPDEVFHKAHNIILRPSLVCGGRFLSATGTIKSPNYPNNYPPEKDCTWIIQVEVGKQIELVVKTFELEFRYECFSDVLEIRFVCFLALMTYFFSIICIHWRNGGSSESPLIGKYCDDTIPPRMQSFSNQIYLRFRSDWSDQYKGFEIEWTSSLSGCGGVFTNTLSGSFTTPNYPLVCYYALSPRVIQWS